MRDAGAIALRHHPDEGAPMFTARLFSARAISARVRAARHAGTSAAGMSTAEYAIGTVAACAFAALLYKVVTSTQILDLLTGVVSRALHVPF
jgi:hypothetical protein